MNNSTTVFRPKSLDLTVTLNGLPIAAIKLKNPLSSQTIEDAKKQYIPEEIIIIA